MATASSIFKIRAIADFLAPKASDGSGSTLLSFRQSQAFYVLSTDKRKGLYFVSTQYATPFARTAVSGLVPMSHFELVDLLSKDPGSSAAQAKAKAAAAAAAAASQAAAAAVIAPAAEPLPAASTSRTKENITKRLYSYLHSNVRRHSEGALLAPPELRPGEEDHRNHERRRAGTIPRNVTPAQQQQQQQQQKSSNSNNLRRSPTSMLMMMATPAAQQQQHSVDPAARVTDIEVIAVAANTTTTTSFAIRVTRDNAPTTIVTRTYDDFTILATSLLQTFANGSGDRDDEENNNRGALPALPPPPPSSSSTTTLITPALAEQLRRRLDAYVRHLRHGTPATVGDCAAVCEFLAPRDAHEAIEQQRPRKDSGFSSSFGVNANASSVDGMAVDMESKLNIMSPRPRRAVTASDEQQETTTGGGEFDFAEDFYQAYV
ncbi:hypothetical protein HDU87_000393 [Geranomyces variabilis]|uniref:PX domain-containing protein n=1 Tax=Geranomyces variabilis TaxID=109894 RepID=A0AAD5TNX0_9FUNG|nr:hypothetical protein HDU87_000393 [Geranomyces variabilis]